MKLLKFLASVTVCIAFDSGVKSLSDVHSDSHSIRKGRALSDGSTQLVGKAKDGKSDTAEEERFASETFASVGRYFGRPAAKENAKLSEKLLPLGRDEDGFATNAKLVVGLFEEVKKGRKDKGPQLMELVVKMQKVEESKEFADTTMVTMFKNPKTMNLVVKEWIEAGKTPTEASEFLLRHVKDQKWIDFVNSDMFHPWLTYVSRYYMNMKDKSTLLDKLALATSVKKLFHENRSADEVKAANAKLGNNEDGTLVDEIIAFAPA